MRMKITHRIIVITLVVLDFLLLAFLLLHGKEMTLLDPKGLISSQERDLIVVIPLLMLLIVIPVFIFTFFVSWRYRAGNKKATYTPDWDHSTKLQMFLWGVPFALIVVLSIINWHAAHALDPHKPITSVTKPVTIQVVALQWKWLFIYPEEHIATVNYIAFPEKTPINFVLTGDAPMNSFWIPSLGGQMYAMAGMQTRLHLMADKQGEFPGSAAEISGRGFSGMKFIAKSVSRSDYDAWVTSVKKSPNVLMLSDYKKLAEPSENTPPTFYSSTEDDLYNTIMMQFMAPASHRGEPQTVESGQEMHGMSGM